MEKNNKNLHKDFLYLIEDSPSLVREVNILSYSETKQKAKNQTDWLVKPLIPKGGLTYVASPPKTYKSFFALIMAMAISKGEDFMGVGDFPSKKGNVLYIDEENGSTRLGKRLKQIEKGFQKSDEINNLYFCTKENIKLNHEGVKIINKLVKKYSINVIIFDSIVRFIEGDEDKSTDIRKTYDSLKLIQGDNNLSIIVLHHLRKGVKNRKKIELNDLRGSSDFSAMADSILGLVKSKDGVELQIIDSRDAPVDGLNWFFQIIGSDEEEFIKFKYLGKNKKVKSNQSKPDKALEEINNFFEEYKADIFRKKEINEYLLSKGFKKNVIDRTLNMGLDNLFEKIDHGVYKKIIKENKKETDLEFESI